MKDKATYINPGPESTDADIGLPVVPESSLPDVMSLVPAGMDPNKWLKLLEDALDFQTRMHEVLIKKINVDTDIVVLGGKGQEVVCITKNLAYKWLNLVGGQLRYPRDNKGMPVVVKHTGEDELGKWYGYEAFAEFVSPTGKVSPGTALVTTRHKFFGREGIWEYDKVQKKRVRTGTKLKDVSEIPEEDVRAAAVTMAEKAAIKKGLGMTAFTAEQLTRMGIDPANLKGYTFAAGNKGGGGHTGQSRGGRSQSRSSQSKDSKGIKPDDPISDEVRTGILQYQAEQKLTDAQVMAILGGMGHEKLTELKYKELEGFREQMKVLAIEKV